MPHPLLSPVAFLAATSFAVAAIAQQADKPLRFEGARAEVYKQIGDVKLEIHIFEPSQPAAENEARAAIVFFFGGGWRGGSPRQFEQHCRHLAGQGMVAMAADYRVLSRHGTKAVKCVADGKSAVRWIRQNAERLQVDPQRIVAAGGSAGGHVAACTGVISGLDEDGEDLQVSSRPNAMVLFNPALVLAPVDGRQLLNQQLADTLPERMGVDPQKVSPYHHVAAGAPPTLIFHGTADTTVSFESAETFGQAMTKAGNQCRLSAFEGAKHGFFNYGRGDGQAYRETVKQMDEFLKELGYLEH